MYRLAAMALALSVSVDAVAWAGPTCSGLLGKGCDCAAEISSGATAGDIVRYAASVKTGGYSAADAAIKLKVGDQFTIGRDELVSLNVGPQCRSLPLPGGSTITVAAIGDCACVHISLAGSIAAGPPATPSDPPPSVAPPLPNGLTFGLMMVGLDAALITTLVLNEKPISP